jgi:DNA adenine methylase
MKVVQLNMFGENETIEKVVNVSSVPQRSPFRYPGGKTWLIPTARKWFIHDTANKIYIEPFCGGGSIGLTAAIEGYFEKVILVELDADVASVWKTILGDDCDWLIDKILHFDRTTASLNQVLQNAENSIRERALATLLRNRTNHGGILARGSGLMKEGEAGKGIFSRWYPRTLADRIRVIHATRNKIEFIEGNAFDVIREYSARKDSSFFIDPPYTKAGKRLYNLYEVNNERLFDEVARIQGHFLMTYDDASEIKILAENHRYEWKTIPMQTTHLIKKDELLISDDLNWLD